MQRKIYGFVLMAVLGLSLSSLLTATETPRPATSPLPAVQGELIKIEGDLFTIKDPTGKEKQLRIDQETRVVGVFHQGDYVQAWVLPDGRTESIIAFRKDTDKERGRAFLRSRNRRSGGASISEAPPDSPTPLSLSFQLSGDCAVKGFAS